VERRTSEGMAADAQLDSQFVHMRADEGAMGVVLIEAASLFLPFLELDGRGQGEPSRCQCSAVAMTRLQRPCVCGEGRLLMEE
jgi:hypothetical protein